MISEIKKEFSFEYGIIEYKHRFTIDRSLDDYVVTTLDKCVSLELSHKCNSNGSKDWFEIHCIYKDINNKSQLLKLKLDNYTVKIKYKGNMEINI